MKKIASLAFVLLATHVTLARAETAALTPPFQVEITLSDKAAQKLKETGDTLEVDAYYQGTPLAGDQTPVDDEGSIDLGDDSQTIAKAGIVKFDASEFDGSLLSHVIGHEIEVLINVNSTKFGENVFDCDIFEDKISLAVSSTPKLNCKVADE